MRFVLKAYYHSTLNILASQSPETANLFEYYNKSLRYLSMAGTEPQDLTHAKQALPKNGIPKILVICGH